MAFASWSQPLKASIPRCATLSGIVTLVRRSQSKNAVLQIEIKLSENVTPVILSRLINAPGMMPRTPVRFTTPEIMASLSIAHSSTSVTPGIVVVS